MIFKEAKRFSTRLEAWFLQQNYLHVIEGKAEVGPYV